MRDEMETMLFFRLLSIYFERVQLRAIKMKISANEIGSKNGREMKIKKETEIEPIYSC
jgi:hypothetical protein